MPRILILTVAALAMSAVPATAQEEPLPTPPCPTSEQFATLGLDGKDESFSPEPFPSVGHDIQEVPYNEDSVSRFEYRLDVSGSETKPFATSGTTEFILNWDNDTDLDLYVYDAGGNLLGESVSFNPQNGAGEMVVLTGTAHCTDLRVDVVNYLSAPITAVTLDVNVRNLKP